MESERQAEGPGATGKSQAKAQHYLDVGRYDLAEKTLAQALVQDADNPDLHVMMAMAQLEQQRLQESQESALEAMRLDPENGWGIFVLARVAIVAGRHSEAEKVLLQGLAIYPESPPLLIEYARLMSLTHHDAKALGLLDRALALVPEDADALSLRAAVLAKKNRAAESAASGDRALSSEPDSALSHTRVGLAALQSGRPFRARWHLRQALLMDPSMPDLEECYLEADRCCRWTYLPLYYYSLVIDRVPGRQFALYIVFMVIVGLMRALDLPLSVQAPIVLSYLGWCVYTWIATPLTRLWIKVRPPR